MISLRRWTEEGVSRAEVVYTLSALIVTGGRDTAVVVCTVDRSALTDTSIYPLHCTIYHREIALANIVESALLPVITWSSMRLGSNITIGTRDTLYTLRNETRVRVSFVTQTRRAHALDGAISGANTSVHPPAEKRCP